MPWFCLPRLPFKRDRSTAAIGAWIALLLAPAATAATVTIDGRIDPDEWRGAHHITDFRKTQPLNGEPASLPTEAWVLATPEGLAVAFRMIQPPEVPRTYQLTRRDENASVDRVNVMLDFNGDGRTGYDFTLTLTGGITDAVITNESKLNNDWDGIWEHAVSEDEEGWNAEILIPWHTAPMRKAKDGKRVIGLYLDRVTGSTGERAAWPVTAFSRARFLSEFNKVEFPAYSQSLLAVTPHALAIYDNVNGSKAIKGGADLLWKPNSQTQLTATINPDFGQVESDDLVVNFSAEETFFSDKRPFFTENQGLFDFGMLLDNSQLIYTRRVGSGADDGSGASGIDGALKLTGSLGDTHYGVMAAQEGGEAGRLFSALRLDHDFGEHTLGMLATNVDRPWLDRQASVLGINHRWRPNERLMVRSNLVGSHIDQRGRVVRGNGATMAVDHELGGGWSNQWFAMHFDDRLDVNDFGYLPRNNLSYGHWEVRRRLPNQPDTSAYASREWQVRATGMNNDHGLSLRRELRVTMKGNRRDGGNETFEFNLNAPAHDDLLTRRHGALRTVTNPSLMWTRQRPRKGDWAWKGNAKVFGSELSGAAQPSFKLMGEPTYFLSDALSVSAGLTYEWSPERLIWQRDNLIGSFNSSALQLAAGMAWNIGSRQEFRVRLQALGLDARLRQAYRVDGQRRAVAVSDPVDDFSIRNLGLQLRYRYELAPLSDLYVVYGRGGYVMDSDEIAPVGRRFADSFMLRDSEQVMVKLSYRFVM